ncbi:MAG: 50S ribosomal protein L18 [Nanoarchaeota archaeon]|nr:50S ribosomal protein L18 [Nanoarchaeota archaeon]
MKNIFKRRKEGKTNYSKRRKLLSSNLPRIAFRRTNRYVIAQYITSNEARDKVEIGVTSKELLQHGWPKEMTGSLRSLPASYLTGLLIGKKIKTEKKAVPIPDFGVISPNHKTRQYAFLKGLVDSGLGINPGEKEIFPSSERIEGKHLKKDFSAIFRKIKSEIEK